MSNQDKTIRDFIYLNGDTLNSLYSQLFEGVAEQIVKSRLHSEVQQELQKGEVTKGQIAEAQFSEIKQSTESKVLYDYMYSQLESKITASIFDPSGIGKDNYREALADVFMVKIKGRAEIEDYNRVKVLAERFNDLAGKLAFAETINQLGMSLYQAEALVSSMQGKQKAELKQAIQRWKNPKQLAKEKGYLQDEETLSLINLVTEMFYPDGFEVTLTPTQGDEGIIFRGVIDKQWLRLPPETLKALYGGYTDFEWTMVGQITYMPGGTSPEIPQTSVPNVNIEESVASAGEVGRRSKENKDSPKNEERGPESAAQDNEDVVPERVSAAVEEVTAELPSMRDPFRAFFGTLRGFERMFLESKQRIEIILHPLAIYRETVLKPAEKGGNDN